ncbi:hypothetical protein [Amycolatopsis sp. cmx-4-83]
MLDERANGLEDRDHDDRIRRELLEEMRERILAEIAADWDVTLPASV